MHLPYASQAEPSSFHLSYKTDTNHTQLQGRSSYQEQLYESFM